MVKKLIKYDLMAMAKTMLPMEIIMLAIALFSRITQIFETDSVYYNICFGSSLIFFIVSIIVSIVMVAIVTLTRFYRNLYTAEGYFSFALPVTPAQHILSKLIASILFSIINLAVIFVSVCIITLGDVLTEIFKAVNYIFKYVCQNLGGWNITGYIFEFIVLLLVSACATVMLFYACITLGQTAKKNRILAAFGVYFAYYAIMQLLETGITILFVVLSNYIDFEKIMEYIGEHIKVALHIGLSGTTVIVAAFGLLYYFITHRVMSRKLNLE